MDTRNIEELTESQYLSAQLKEIFSHKLELIVGTAQAYRVDESPIAGRKLANLFKSLEEATEEAGADRLVTILPLLVELVADSLVELIADNNRKLLAAIAKD